jgi:competence protein ComEC
MVDCDRFMPGVAGAEPADQSKRAAGQSASRCRGSVLWCCRRRLLGTVLLPLPYVGAGLLWLAGGLIDWLFRALAVIAGHWPAWIAPSISVWVWALGSLGALLLLLPRGVPMRPLGWPLLLLLVVPPRERLDEGLADVWQLDVGQGLAILIRTRHHALLYDAGPRFGDFDLGERVVLPALRKLSVEKPRSDAAQPCRCRSRGWCAGDHARGLTVGRYSAATRRGCPRNWRRSLRKRPAMAVGRRAFSALAVVGRPRQQSAFLRVADRGQWRAPAMLTGDIDTHAERVLLDSPLAVPTQWLQAPHHGSRSSSSMALLKVAEA